MWAHDNQLNITCHQLNGSVFSKQPHWITASHFLLIIRIFKAAVTKTDHLQWTNDLSFAEQFSIAISDNSALWVTTGGWGVIRRWWFIRHWRDNLSKARFTFAVNWQRWTFTPRLVTACCLLPSHRSSTLPIGRARERALRSFRLYRVRTSFVQYFVCWRTSEKKQ